MQLVKEDQKTKSHSNVAALEGSCLIAGPTVGAESFQSRVFIETTEWHLSTLDLFLDNEDLALWCFMKSGRRPCFTPKLLSDLALTRGLIAQLLTSPGSGSARPFDYFILGSRCQGAFNLGGDLPLFADAIERRDRECLRQYARDCIEVVYANYTGHAKGIITVALIQGDALGGGLEAALSCDILIAERQAKFGLPEVLFGLFPGMGAYTFLSRRIGMLKAEEIILSGRIYTAEEMYALGVVDSLVEQGAGEQAVREYLARSRSHRAAHSALYKVRRCVNPISFDELHAVVEIWVDSALSLSGHHIKKMTRIAAAQQRFHSTDVARSPN